LVVCFFEFLTLSTWGGCNFLISTSFLMIFSVLDVAIGGVQVLFGHKKNNGALPLDLACPKHLNVWSLADLPYHSLEWTFTLSLIQSQKSLHYIYIYIFVAKQHHLIHNWHFRSIFYLFYTFYNIHWYHNCFVHKFQICPLPHLQILSFQFMYKLSRIKLNYFDFEKYYNAHLNTPKRGCCLFYLVEFSLKSWLVGPKFHFLFGALSSFDRCAPSLTIMDQTLETQHEHLSNNFFFISQVAHL
jgi:hypothetical protein